jgi:hypothetical protein
MAARSEDFFDPSPLRDYRDGINCTCGSCPLPREATSGGSAWGLLPGFGLAPAVSPTLTARRPRPCGAPLHTCANEQLRAPLLEPKQRAPFPPTRFAGVPRHQRYQSVTRGRKAGDPEELSLLFARPPGRAEYRFRLYGYSVSTEVEMFPPTLTAHGESGLRTGSTVSFPTRQSRMQRKPDDKA